MNDQPAHDDEGERLARRREQRRRYREANREKINEGNLRWRHANPEKVKQLRERSRPAIERYNAANREKVLQQKRIAARKRSERIRKEEAARARAVERAREWDATHRDRVRERDRRYREANREKLRERQREHYQNNKDKINARNAQQLRTDPKYQQAQARYRQANQEKIQQRRRAYRSDPDVYQRALEYNREWRRRERRRIKAGLPRTRRHHTPKPEKAANEAAADAFFTRTREVEERRRIRAEFDQLRDDKARPEKIAQRRRAEHALILRERASRIDAYLQRHGTKLREEVRMDSRARELRSADPYPDLEQETRRRAAAALTEKPRRRISHSVTGGAQRRQLPDSNTGPVIGTADVPGRRIGI